MKRIDTTVLSKRNTDIPVTIIEADTFPSKLLLCVHGFKANRTEDNRFVEVAEALASNGVSTIMMGFPGCDESKEDSQCGQKCRASSKSIGQYRQP